MCGFIVKQLGKKKKQIYQYENGSTASLFSFWRRSSASFNKGRFAYLRKKYDKLNPHKKKKKNKTHIFLI